MFRYKACESEGMRRTDCTLQCLRMKHNTVDGRFPPASPYKPKCISIDRSTPPLAPKSTFQIPTPGS